MGKKSSISCDKYQDMIYNYFSDNLSEEQIEKLEDHISSCLLCKNEFEQIRALLSSAEQFEDQPLPVGFTTSLHTKFRIEEHIDLNIFVKTSLQMENGR